MSLGLAARVSKLKWRQVSHQPGTKRMMWIGKILYASSGRLRPCVCAGLSLVLCLLVSGCGAHITGTTGSVIVLAASSTSIAPHASTQVKATITNSIGVPEDVTAQVAWQTSNPAAGTLTGLGLFTAGEQGSTTVTATLAGATGTLAISVIAPSLTSLSLSPAAVSLTTGGGQQYALNATYSDDTTRVVTSPVLWTVSPANVATISDSGILSTLAPGSYTVLASIGPVTATARGTVEADPTTGSGGSTDNGPSLTALSLSPKVASLSAGGLQQYALSATYSGNATDAISSPVTWTVTPSSVATISSSGLLSAIGPGTYTVLASEGSTTTSAQGTVAANSPSDPGVGTGAAITYPISVYLGADLSSFPVFNVSTFAASGSGAVTTCTGEAGSTLLMCAGKLDFSVGQGIRVVGGGASPAEAAITVQPLIAQRGNSTTGTHTFCYVVDTVDPLGGISQPSPAACLTNEPDLALTTIYNSLGTTTSNVGPSPSFLWYVSEDGAPFYLLNVAKFSSGAIDVGQRIGSRGGWPDGLPAASPNIAKQDDLFSTVQAVTGNQITLADPLVSPVTLGTVDHDDTQAVQSAILASVQSKGGTIVFGPGTFNLRRPAFSYVVDNSYAYPPYTIDLALDPWWGGFSYLYIPNGSVGNIDFEGAGRSTVLVTAADHGGTAGMLIVGNEQREGAVGTPMLTMEEVAKGSKQITLTSAAEASTLSPGDDIFIYSGSFEQTPDIDHDTHPDLNHFTELNTVASMSGNIVTLVYPTAKRYFDDGGSSWGLTKLPVTPHNIELQHLTIQTWETIIGSGDVIGELINDVQMLSTLSNGAFGGGYKRGLTIEHCKWTFGEGTTGWGQEDEYDEFTDLAFIDNTIKGYAAPASEGASGMAKIYATEGTSEVLFTGNTFDHVSLYADQTTEYYVQNNTFIDGIVAAGMAYAPYTEFTPSLPGDRSFLSFDSQDSFSTDHNTFEITPDFTPPWIIRAGNFAHGNVSDNTIKYGGVASPSFFIGTYNGTVINNKINISSPKVGNVILLVPDESPLTLVSTFEVEGNHTTGQTVASGVAVLNSGFTDTGAVCIRHNTLQASQGAAVVVASSAINQACP